MQVRGRYGARLPRVVEVPAEIAGLRWVRNYSDFRRSKDVLEQTLPEFLQLRLLIVGY